MKRKLMFAIAPILLLAVLMPPSTAQEEEQKVPYETASYVCAATRESYYDYCRDNGGELWYCYNGAWDLYWRCMASYGYPKGL